MHPCAAAALPGQEARTSYVRRRYASRRRHRHPAVELRPVLQLQLLHDVGQEERLACTRETGEVNDSASEILQFDKLLKWEVQTVGMYTPI